MRILTLIIRMMDNIDNHFVRPCNLTRKTSIDRISHRSYEPTKGPPVSAKFRRAANSSLYLLRNLSGRQEWSPAVQP